LGSGELSGIPRGFESDLGKPARSNNLLTAF
jgi:hypothetical protein